MPSKNALKIYSAGGFCHIYNRGVAKNLIFIDDQDYGTFLSYLKEYLSPFVPPTAEEIRRSGYVYIRKNYQQQIELIAFVLMPNHFHLLLKQNESRSIEGFMRSLLTRYARYFNRHHDRVGHLLQDVYKGILVDNEDYFLWLGRYIHRNPMDLLDKKKLLVSYLYSSYPAYLKSKGADWLATKYLLNGIKNYRDFVEGNNQNERKSANEVHHLE